MRSLTNHAFDSFSDPCTLFAAYKRCRQGRRRRNDLAEYELDAPQKILELSRSLQAESWHPGPARIRLIHDPKLRPILISPVEDRIVHQALVYTISPAFTPGFLDQHFACSTGRGPQRATLYALKQLRRHRYRCCFDVSRFFPTMRRDILLTLLTHRIQEPRLLRLLSRILDHGGKLWQHPRIRAAVGPVSEQAGVPIGSYLSHFSGALYLDALDHRIKRQLKIPGYLRYMDDLALFADSRQQLEDARADISSWLLKERGQVFKASTGKIQRTTDSMRFLGWRISAAGLRPGKKLLRAMKKKIRIAILKGPKFLFRTLTSYKALLSFP
jgi:retron-type reverse transcriptase